MDDAGRIACETRGLVPLRDRAVVIPARLRRLPDRPLAIVRTLLATTGDLSTPEGRARERQRRATLAALMSMAAKLVSVATALLTVPITLHYLGAERYGMWMILSSMVAMLSFADLGIGNGILNAVAAAHGRNDTAAIRRAVSSGAVALGGIMLLVLAGLAIAYRHVAWHELFNVRSALARAESGPAIAAFLICFAVSIPATMVQRVQQGMQRGFLASAWLCVGSLFTLPAVLLAVHLEAGLPVLVAVLMGAPLIAGIINSVVFFGMQEPGLRPAPGSVVAAEIRGVAQAGLFFLMIQLGNSVSANCLPIIISHVAGPERVADFSVPERLLALVVMLVSMYVQPLWPAYREALMQGDGAWVRRTYRATVLRVLVAATAVLIMLGFAMPVILRLWVGSAVQPSMLLIAGLCAFKLCESLLWVNAMVLNGVGAIAQQALLAIANAVLLIVATYWACAMFGLPTVPWTAGAVLAVVSLLPGTLLILHKLRGLMPSATPAPALTPA